MKFCVNLLLFVFLTFLSTPTIVSVIEKSCDTTIFFTMSEEECHKEIKLAVVAIAHSYELSDISATSSSLIVSENLSRHDHISAAIFIPPPDQI